MKPLTIVADENMEGVTELLGELGTVRLLNGREIQAVDLSEADVLLVRSITRVDECLLADSPVRFVGTATSGFDHIDREYLSRSGISFAHAPGSNANSVVEYVLAAIAGVDDKLEQLFQGAAVGIIGYGNIGTLLARRLAALDIAYKVYDPWLDQSQVSNSASLEEVLRCDVVSIHAELTRKNPWPSFHLLGSPELSLLGENCLLINASRGAVIDNAALEAILSCRPGLKVVLDVWEGEPFIKEALLDKVYTGTAHIAGYSQDGKFLATRMLKESLLSHLNSRDVNKKSQVANTTVIVSLSQPLSGAALLRALLQHNYDINVDDSLLRAAVTGQASSVVAANFDHLRKAYRSRRELFGSVVDAASVKPMDTRILEAMGCILIDRSSGGAVT